MPIVLMGDAAHTAHFSIDSGTKLALEDAIELACCLREHPDTGDALASYEAVRSVEVLKIQNAARNSTEWFENVDRYSGPKGSTQVGWAEPDEPLPAGNWLLIAASSVPYGPTHQVPRALPGRSMAVYTRRRSQR